MHPISLKHIYVTRRTVLKDCERISKRLVDRLGVKIRLAKSGEFSAELVRFSERFRSEFQAFICCTECECVIM